MAIDLSPYQAVLLDLDGTVYREDHPLPGAIELIRHLQQTGKPFACLSNSTSSPLRIVLRLAAMGVELLPDQVYTAAAAAADYVVQNWPTPKPKPREAERPIEGVGVPPHDPPPLAATLNPIADPPPAPPEQPPPPPPRKPRVYNLATEGIHDMLDELVEWVHTDAEPCDAVVIGTPANVFATEDRQRTALRLLRKGAAAVGICGDRVYPSPRGLEFGSGALTWMLCYAAAVEPVFCGKPQAIFFEELCHRMGVDPAWCLLVGDNLEADIFGAKGVGMRTVLTLTGVTRRRDLLAVPPELQPDLVAEDLTEFLAP